MVQPSLEHNVLVREKKKVLWHQCEKHNKGDREQEQKLKNNPVQRKAAGRVSCEARRANPGALLYLSTEGEEKYEMIWLADHYSLQKVIDCHCSRVKE